MVALLKFIAIRILPELVLMLIKHILGFIDSALGISKTIRWFKRRTVYQSLAIYAKKYCEINKTKTPEQLDIELVVDEKLFVDCGPIISKTDESIKGVIGSDSYNAFYAYIPAKWSWFFKANGEWEMTKDLRYTYRCTIIKKGCLEYLDIYVKDNKNGAVIKETFVDDSKAKKQARGIHHACVIKS